MDFEMPRIPPGFQRPLYEGNPAHWTHDKLRQQILAFEAGLDADHEVGGRMVSAGGLPAFHLEDIGYLGPYIVLLWGRDSDGNAVELFQHHTQVSVMLVALPKLEAKARRIGFGIPSAKPDE